MSYDRSIKWELKNFWVEVSIASYPHHIACRIFKSISDYRPRPSAPSWHVGQSTSWVAAAAAACNCCRSSRGHPGRLLWLFKITFFTFFQFAFFAFLTARFLNLKRPTHTFRSHTKVIKIKASVSSIFLLYLNRN